MPRFFAEIIDANQARIRGKDVRHIAGPLRRRVGDMLAIRDEQRGYAARITGLTRQEVRLEIIAGEELVDRSVRRIRLGIALVAPQDMDEIMRLTSELGVHDIHPLVAERSNFRAVTSARRRRWEDIILEAVKQCGRKTIPCLHPETDLSSFLETSSSLWPVRLIALQNAEQTIARIDRDDVGILIGPEGGFTASEVGMALNQGFLAVHMGRTTLRAVGAAVAAVAILGA